MKIATKRKWIALARECLRRADLDNAADQAAALDQILGITEPSLKLREWAFEVGGNIEAKEELDT